MRVSLLATLLLSSVASGQLVTVQPKAVDIDVAPRLDVESGALTVNVPSVAVTGIETGGVVVDPLHLEVAPGAIVVRLEGSIAPGAVVIDMTPVGHGLQVIGDAGAQALLLAMTDFNERADERMGDIKLILAILVGFVGLAVVGWLFDKALDNRREARKARA